MKRMFIEHSEKHLSCMAAEAKIYKIGSTLGFAEIIKESLSKELNRYLMFFFDSQLTKSLFIDFLSKYISILIFEIV